MNRGRLTALWSAIALAAAGLGFALSGSAGGATTSSAAPAVRYVVVNCENKAQVKPGSYVLACADDGMGLEGLHWTSWTAQLASAYGTEYENDCVPNCAAGHFRRYPVMAVLWGSASVKGQPAERRYTRVTLIYKAARPPVYEVVNGKVVATYPVTQTLPLAP